MTFLLSPETGYAYSPSGTQHPNPLRLEDRFVVWRGVAKGVGGFEKHAIHPGTHRSKGYRYSKPENHLPYRRAKAIAEGPIARTHGIYGVSFVPSRSGGFVFVDIDKVFDLKTGELLEPWAVGAEILS